MSLNRDATRGEKSTSMLQGTPVDVLVHCEVLYQPLTLTNELYLDTKLR